jgi:hypothetical protein
MKDDLNLYVYAKSDPANFTDPFGEQSCPDKNNCPDIPLPKKEDRQMVIEAVSGAQRGNERGAHLLESQVTGEKRLVKGKDAGKASGSEFEHNVKYKPNERLVLLGHKHTASDARGTQGLVETKSNNAPSTDDQVAMNKAGFGKGAPVVTVGPNVTTTMYRIGGVDRLRVEAGDRSKLPDVSSQQIVVDPEIEQ